MKEIVRTVCEIVWVVLVFAASTVGVYWLLHSYIGLPWEGTILLLAPTVLLGALAAIYGYSVAWKQRRTAESQLSPSVAFQRVFRLFVFVLLLLIPASLAAYFLFLGNITLMLLFSVIAALISLWVIRKLREEFKLL